MRSIWKVNKKYYRSFKNIKKTTFLKRGDIIPFVSSFGKKVSVYNVEILFLFIFSKK